MTRREMKKLEAKAEKTVDEIHKEIASMSAALDDARRISAVCFHACEWFSSRGDTLKADQWARAGSEAVGLGMQIAVARDTRSGH